MLRSPCRSRASRKVAKILRTGQRPRPPRSLIEDMPGKFIPAPEVFEWFRDVIIDAEGPVYNEDHQHLADAHIGVLWTTAGNSRQGRRIIGQAEFGEPQGSMGKWAKARARQQVEEWFGATPDFIMTLDAYYCTEASDVEFCALAEHELYHMAQAIDEFGMPKFKKDGRPVFAMRGHDVEEFVGVVRRYGIVDSATAALVAAANRGPEIASVSIAQACGTCQARRAA